MNIKDLSKDIDNKISFYSKTAIKIIESAPANQDTGKVLTEGMKVQDIAVEYIKLSAQLQCVALAHEVAKKAGWVEN